MVSRNDIHKFLEDAGIKKNDTVLVHTSMRSIGEVEGGCDGLIDGFVSYLSEGLFIVPTHTWGNVGEENRIFDVRVTRPCIGALPCVAAFRPDGVRSMHPTHSVAAFGENAKRFLRGEDKATTPCPVGGVWSKLLDVDAKILLIGVGLDRNTYIHAIDEMLDLPGRLAPPVELTVIDHYGNCKEINFSKHGETGSKFFENYRTPLEKLGALETRTLGNAKVGVFHTAKATEIIKKIWSRAEYNICAEFREIPEEYYN